MAKVRLEVEHTSVTLLLPAKHAKALAVMKKETGETRSEVIRNLVAVELMRYAQTSPRVREILYGKA